MPPRRENNNFDLFRLITGIGVVLVHISVLTNSPALAFIERGITFPLVPSFFVISGFLVTASYERADSLARYTKARARRIIPAYACVVLLCGLLLPASASPVPYLLANLSTLNFLEPTLPGVFTHNPEAAVNGSLWSIKVEVMFYICLPAIVHLCRKFSPAVVWGSIYAVSVSYYQSFHYLGELTGYPLFYQLQHQMPGCASYMATGALVHYYRASFDRWKVPLSAFALAGAAAGWLGDQSPVAPLLTGLLTMAFCLGPFLGRWGKYGDFSYGLYLFHYPLIQCLIAAGYAADHPWLFLMSALGLSLAAAVLSWHLVEKHFLSRARRPAQDLAVKRAEALAGVP